MAYTSLAECALDLERTGRLVRISEEVDPRLELGLIQRRAYRAGAPALLFTRLKGCRFPALANLFGTAERARFVLRHGLRAVERLVRLKVDPLAALRQPWKYASLPLCLPHLFPLPARRAPVLEHRCRIEDLPQQVSWPGDGGPFITLPVVYSEDVSRPGWMRSNLGMYRIQLAGGDYVPGRQVGLHYQIHRGIGAHHAAALEAGLPFAVNVFVGGPPALAFSAVMPLPEGIPEIAFAGLLGGRGVRLARQPPGGLPVAADADFCIVGRVEPRQLKPEGPFGDHLGYYSLAHDYPVLQVQAVHHRQGAIWPFTSVGRPPQEDTVFGELIHELTRPLMPAVLPGVHAVHAVDAAGVHPLLLAQASERYTPYQARKRPQELLTCANALLGQGQLSLAKFLWICAREDDPQLDIRDVGAFFRHLLARVDWRTDLHFQTRTTIDTLDYSGEGLNQGSKVVIAAAGPVRRTLCAALPEDVPLPGGFRDPRVCLPGVVVLSGPDHQFDPDSGKDLQVAALARALGPGHPLRAFPLLVVADDSGFASRSLADFLWVTFTRANPAADIYGVEERIYQKHWGCVDTLIVDSRIKPHHAPPLEDDPEVARRVEHMAAPGGGLHGLLG
ncbi:MAG: UbiD family decarboxylase [Armatimonadetes bacterium]|nr:UbiD family decarboxylase [Armatimonadota bacterium]